MSTPGTHSPTLASLIDDFIAGKQANQAPATARTYRTAMNRFTAVMRAHDVDPLTHPATELDEDWVFWLIEDMRELAAATEALYLAAFSELCQYAHAMKIKALDLPRLFWLIRKRGRKNPARYPTFPRHEVDVLVEYALDLDAKLPEDVPDRLRNLRDRALIVTLADTGLRIHEACKLCRGDIDPHSRRAVIIGKGDKQAVVRFSVRAVACIQAYLAERTRHIDGKSGKPLNSLPLFIRHDLALNAKSLKPMKTRTGQNIIEDRVTECLGADYVHLITPHTLRHYFITRVVTETRDIKLAQELARHANIAVTGRYAHLAESKTDDDYRDIFD